jgi:hypothetical protein
MPSISQLIPVLQTAIGPVILISGIGLLLLTMTNRLGRAIDRARLLVVELENTPGEARSRIESQLHILWRRAGIIRSAITLASLSALTAAVMILTIFVVALLQLEAAWLIGGIFIVSMVCLIASLILFIRDINKSLAALKLELKIDRLNDADLTQ